MWKLKPHYNKKKLNLQQIQKTMSTYNEYVKNKSQYTINFILINPNLQQICDRLFETSLGTCNFLHRCES